METVTTVTGDTETVEVTVATEFRSATTVAFRERQRKKKVVSPFSCVCKEITS